MPGARHSPPPHKGSRFFHFDKQNFWNVTALGVHAPLLWGPRPPTGNPESATGTLNCFIILTNVMRKNEPNNWQKVTHLFDPFQMTMFVSLLTVNSDLWLKSWATAIDPSPLIKLKPRISYLFLKYQISTRTSYPYLRYILKWPLKWNYYLNICIFSQEGNPLETSKHSLLRWKPPPFLVDTPLQPSLCSVDCILWSGWLVHCLPRQPDSQKKKRLEQSLHSEESDQTSRLQLGSLLLQLENRNFSWWSSQESTVNKGTCWIRCSLRLD